MRPPDILALLTVHDGIRPGAYITGTGWFVGPVIDNLENPVPQAVFDREMALLESTVTKDGIKEPAWTQLPEGVEALCVTIAENLEPTPPPVAEAVCEDPECRCHGLTCEDEQWDELREDRC